MRVIQVVDLEVNILVTLHKTSLVTCIKRDQSQSALIDEEEAHQSVLETPESRAWSHFKHSRE